VKRWLYPALLLVALLGLWQLAASTGFMAEVLGVEDFLVPSPAEIASSLWEDRSLLAENGWVTLVEIVLGFALSVAIGLLFAVAMHLSTTIRLTTNPLVIVSQTIPILVLAPILVIWFGFGIIPKLIIITLICFFPITVATLDGLRSVDPAAIKLMRTLYASRAQIFRRVEAPTALPSFFSGARIAVAIAPIGAVFAEWAGSSEGLGHLILTYNANFRVAPMFAAVVVLSAIAVALYVLLALAERRVVTWR
jgi:ABC-type nitrate/sulfonate/bicarbonate transport system permease component